MHEQIKKAVEVLKNGGIGIFPTDTAFGIGCRADEEKAIKRLFEIRRRPETQPMSILVDTVSIAKKYVEEIPQEVIDKLIEPFWPGALTIILKAKKDAVSRFVRAGGDTVGIRIPNHAITRQLIRETGVGILGPSANFHGEPTPYAFEELNPELVQLVDFVLSGECTVKEESTVVDCIVKPWNVLRSGPIKIKI